MTRPLHCGLLLAACLPLTVQADLIANGDFAMGLSGWTTSGDVTLGGPDNTAVLGEGSFINVLEQTVTLCAAPAALSFEFGFEQIDDPSSGGFFDDAFSVDVFDISRPPFWIDSFGFDSDTVLAIDSGGVFENQGTITAGDLLPNRFNVDLSSLGLGAGDALTVAFVLLADANGVASTARVDNVQITPVPLPGSLLLGGLGLVSGSWLRRRRTSA